MPELPEVETIARRLAPELRGKRIPAVQVHWRRSIVEDNAGDLERDLPGSRCCGVSRRGKYLRLDLASGRVLLVHLRMSGRLHLAQMGAVPSRWLRVRFELDGGRALDFIDPRKFGRLYWLADEHRVLSSLGPEPLGGDFDATWLLDALHARRRQLKPLLLDQRFLAGLGNIYTDESLFLARLHPRRLSSSIRRPEARRLCQAVRRVLSEAIAADGSSFDRFYRTPQGQPGSYQESFWIYGRAGKPCRRCGGAVQRILVGQRGTHLCTRCQPPPP